MKCGLLIVCCASVVVSSFAGEWRPAPELLKAVRKVESNNGLNLVGDNGESLGAFQLSEAAWLDVNSYRKARNLKTYPYSQTVFQPFISREYAATYLTILHDGLNRKLKRAPSSAEIYAAYNLGFSSFAQCDFKLHRVNSVTRARCEKITLLLDRPDSP